MKHLFFVLIVALILVGCGSEPDPERMEELRVQRDGWQALAQAAGALEESAKAQQANAENVGEVLDLADRAMGVAETSVEQNSQIVKAALNIVNSNTISNVLNQWTLMAIGAVIVIVVVIGLFFPRRVDHVHRAELPDRAPVVKENGRKSTSKELMKR